MKAISYVVTFLFGVFVALLVAFVATGGTSGATAVVLGAWGAWWLMMAGGFLVARYNASDAVDHFEDDYLPPARMTMHHVGRPTRHLRPPVQHHILTIRHEPGQPTDVEVADARDDYRARGSL